MAMSLYQKYWLPVVFGGCLILLWYGCIAWFELHPFVLPPPDAVLRAFVTESEVLLQASVTTLTGAGLGFVLAVAVGFAMALVLVSLPWLRHGIYPYILFMQMTPIISTAAIIVILFDVGLQSVVLIAFFIGFFPVVASTLQGLMTVPEGELELLRLYRATPLQILLFLRIPHALPYFFTGAKIAATLAVIGSVTGEIFAGSSDGRSGLGFLIITFKSELKIAAIYAATLLA